MIITDEVYLGRKDDERSADWQPDVATGVAGYVRGHASLAWVMGAGSVIDFSLADVDALPGEGCDLYEVRQHLDLTDVTLARPVIFRLSSLGGGALRGSRGVVGFYPFGEYRFTLIRYGAICFASYSKLADILVLDCSSLCDACGVPIPAQSLILLRVRGHGSSGSIQLVSRSLGLRLLESYPSIYSA
jgi:hypothetical protein